VAHQSGGGGSRTTAVFSANSAILDQRGAKSGALASVNPDLASVVTAWPHLPDAVKAAVLALVQSIER
jgi:hypothetical protein